MYSSMITKAGIPRKKTVIIGVSKFESALELLESPTQVCPEESHEKSDLLH